MVNYYVLFDVCEILFTTLVTEHFLLFNNCVQKKYLLVADVIMNVLLHKLNEPNKNGFDFPYLFIFSTQ
jgi:hypothetical protein